MIKSKTFTSIINTVNLEGYSTYKELSETLKCSESTARRLVDELSAAGKIIKERGGASSLEANSFYKLDQSLLTRERIDAPIKKRIALKAKELIKNNMTIYIDAGSSTLFLAREIKNTTITVVTNSFSIAKILTAQHINTYLVGGQIKLDTDAAVGPMAVKSISTFTFDYGFFGTNGLSCDKGFTTPDIEEAYVKTVAIENSNKSVFLVNASKFNKYSVVSFADIKNKIIVTNYKDTNKKYSEAEIVEV